MRFTLLLLALLASGPSLAQEEPPPSADDARARELFENGRVLHEEGRYEDAIAAWEEGYRLSKRPLFLFNIGNAHEKLGDLGLAIEYFNRYRAFAPEEERVTLERKIRALEERLGDVQTEPEPEPEPEPVVPEPLPTPKQPRVTPTAIAVYGVGIAGLGLGTTFGLMALHDGRQAEDHCVSTGGGLVCGVEADEWVAKEKRHALLADAGFGIGAACIIGTTLVVLLDDPGPVRVGPLPLSEGGGVLLGGSFR
ncbi:MAG: tetratricopeptide repeat protein [Deltaproteobacteria bacterium]|nr:tetratricopeptide repeat protein [Deltaproteobacteria bacterium]